MHGSNWSTQGREKVGPDKIELQANVERTPVSQRGAEWSSRSVVDPVRKKRSMQKTSRTVAESKCTIEPQPISRSAIDVRSKARGSQRCSSVCTREERRCSCLLDRDVKSKNRRVLLPENSQHDSGGVYDRDRNSRITSERLPDRGARDIRLLRRARDDRPDICSRSVHLVRREPCPRRKERNVD